MLTINVSLKYDPTRTTQIRRRFIADMTRRIAAVRRAIRLFFVTDSLAMLEDGKVGPTVNLAPRSTYAFTSDATKLSDFNVWLGEQTDANLLTIEPATGQPWSTTYVKSSYRKGAVRAYIDAHKAELTGPSDIYEGDQSRFLESAFTQGEMLSKLELVGTRTFEELKGVSATMSQQLNRTLAEGLANGWNPNKTAREMFKRIGVLERTRFRTIARTETIRAHAEGQLDSFELNGVKEVGAMVEWSTAGDERVCEECLGMEAEVFTIDEARGLIPLHPNCRCAWLPAGVGPTEKQERAKARAAAQRRIGERQGRRRPTTRVQGIPGKPQTPTPTPTLKLESPSIVLKDGNLSYESYARKYEGLKPTKRIRYDWLRQQPRASLNEKQIQLIDRYDHFWKDGVHRSIKPEASNSEWLKSLTQEELKEINNWKRGSYTLRQYQLGQITEAELKERLIYGDVRWGGKHIANAFSRAGNYDGTIYRGSGLLDEFKNLKVGDDLRWNANYSTSKSKKVAEMFRREVDGESVLFEIKAKTAVDIDKVGHVFLEQQEVVTRVGSRYIVEEVKRIKDGLESYTKVILREVP